MRKSKELCLFLENINLPKLQDHRITNWMPKMVLNLTKTFLSWTKHNFQQQDLVGKGRQIDMSKITQAKFVTLVTFNVFHQKWIKSEWFSMKYDISISFYQLHSRRSEVWLKSHKNSDFIMPQIVLLGVLIVYLLFFSLKWNEITIMKKNKEKAL